MDKAEIFNGIRPLLFTIAYDMLGSVMDAEDMVQEAYLRWQDVEGIESPKAYLTTTVTNLCINFLTSAKVRREAYIGPWLPEPLVSQTGAKPDDIIALSESVSMAFLVLLESLSPIERAVFLLRKVFDYDYADISRMVSKDEAACRQIVSRAQQRLQAEKARFTATREQQEKLTMQFLQTCISGDMDGLLVLLAEDIVLQTDSGGTITHAARKPVRGARNVAVYLLNILKAMPSDLKLKFGLINGQLGLVSYRGEKPFSVMALHIVDGRIQNIYNIMNPAKLKHIPREE
ncbi:MAG: RNA polymerase sigma-70 factor [Anaerolineae bacterium]|nr:RNA polymerase sigma-70 factor [Anaerolineae bacterium]